MYNTKLLSTFNTYQYHYGQLLITMSYQLELRHYKYFQAVADELNYRKAAEKLFISQPGLSRQIKQMEEILEAPLFERTKRKVALTAAGEFLKKEIDFLMNHLELTKKQVQMIHQGDKGEVRIGFLGSAMQKVIPELLVKMNDQYPGLKTSLEEMSNINQVSYLEKDMLDVGFVRLARVPAGLKLRPVFEDTFSVVLPKDHPLNQKSFKSVQQLKEEEFILFSSDYSQLYYDKIMSICEDQGFSPKVSHRSVHAPTIFKLVENRLGIAIVPSALQHGFDFNIKFLEIPNITQRTTLSVVWKENNRNPALQNLVNLIFGSKV